VHELLLRFGLGQTTVIDLKNGWSTHEGVCKENFHLGSCLIIVDVNLKEGQWWRSFFLNVGQRRLNQASCARMRHTSKPWWLHRAVAFLVFGHGKPLRRMVKHGHCHSFLILLGTTRCSGKRTLRNYCSQCPLDRLQFNWNVSGHAMGERFDSRRGWSS